MNKVRVSGNRQCIICGSYKTRINKTKNGTPYSHWRYVDGKVYCHKCYCREVSGKELMKAVQGKILIYKKRRIILKERILTGQCTFCKRTVISGEIHSTTTHHFEYDDNNPLAFTVELCRSCHARENWILEQFKPKPEKPIIFINNTP